jgi:hypothetical protein
VAGPIYPQFAKQVSLGAPQQVREAKGYGANVGGLDFGLVSTIKRTHSIAGSIYTPGHLSALPKAMFSA